MPNFDMTPLPPWDPRVHRYGEDPNEDAKEMSLFRVEPERWQWVGKKPHDEATLAFSEEEARKIRQGTARSTSGEVLSLGDQHECHL